MSAGLASDASVDALCAAAAWPQLYERGRADTAVTALCEYRLALLGPPQWVALVLDNPSSAHPANPLAEVAASSHTWRQLAPHLDPPAAAVFAGERVVRGEDLTTTMSASSDIPMALQAWEPAYALAEYTTTRAAFPTPTRPALTPVVLPEPGEQIGDPDSIQALKDLVAEWTSGPNGRVDALVAEGDHLTAIAALGPTRARIGRIDPADAMSWMAWAGASSGATGRRAGAAVGRAKAWRASAAIAGVGDQGAVTPDELGAAADLLEWYLWETDEAITGWYLGLAVRDPDEELAIVVRAHDFV